MALIDHAIVKITHRESSSSVGGGCLVSKKHILTCAHVIAAALDMDGKSQNTPQDTIHVQFPFLKNTPLLDAKVVIWKPKSDDHPSDIAVLEISGEIPTDAIPARISDVALKDFQAFKAYGFPII
ncbi:MAG: trypsin-like peptidase domain-containing protein [Anaerolineae bacterium]|nr:trypsin-like peptidase domain-containing protein [Anaerolineae bacterium]